MPQFHCDIQRIHFLSLDYSAVYLTMGLASLRWSRNLCRTSSLCLHNTNISVINLFMMLFHAAWHVVGNESTQKDEWYIVVKAYMFAVFEILSCVIIYCVSAATYDKLYICYIYGGMCPVSVIKSVSLLQ